MSERWLPNFLCSSYSRSARFFIMDVLYTSGIRFAETLQVHLSGLEHFWLWASFLGDPKCIFIVYFPLTYFLDQKVGVKVLWLGLISEWLNIVCKWFLFGERPFWWVFESGFSSKEEVLLHQFPATCETGPGIGLGWLLESRIPLERKLSFYLWTALSLYLSTMMTYWALLTLGVDLNWSITLATKWCANPSWIRMETRPFSSLCRDVATVLGLGLALHSSYYTQLKGKRLSWPQRTCCAGLALVVLQLLSEAVEPQDVALWYGLSFVKYATFPWVVVALLPKAVSMAISKATQPHKD
ncbi:hypothetical protein lerEdw1_006535 [Lerista edwardsae]|nr:hypothetical protein lerEdw1_006535 [Lerista edwardsae]